MPLPSNIGVIAEKPNLFDRRTPGILSQRTEFVKRERKNAMTEPSLEQKFVKAAEVV
jgi:hypothetical protein